MNIIQINPDTDPRWDNYIASHPHATIYHCSSWARVLQETYGYRPLFVAGTSDDDARLTGAVPLVSVDNWVKGQRIVSLPFTAYCDPLDLDGYLDEVIALARRSAPDARRIEFRLRQGGPHELSGEPSQFVTHILPLDEDPDELFKRFHNSCVRRRIKRAKKQGLSVRWKTTDSDLKTFYQLQTEVRKRHGLPPPPFKFFENMRRILMPEGHMTLPVVEFEGKVIAAAIILNFNNTFHMEYIAADTDYQSQSPTQLLIWETIKSACEANAEFYDFGRTRVSHGSLMEFKERWGAEKKEIHYYYGSESNEASSKKNDSRKIITSINRHLPEVLLQWEGNLVYRYFG